MKIDSLSKLLNSVGSSFLQSKNSQSTQEDAKTAEEAVRVSSDLKNISAQEVAKADNSKKIADLKSRIREGSYNPNSQDIAGAVARELFA